MRGKVKTAVLEQDGGVKHSSVYIGEEEQKILDQFGVVSKSKLVRVALQYYAQQVERYGLNLQTFMPNDHPIKSR